MSRIVALPLPADHYDPSSERNRNREIENHIRNRVYIDDYTLAMPVRGTGSPNGVIIATPGKLYINLSGGANTTLWVKESGTGNTGWVAK